MRLTFQPVNTCLNYDCSPLRWIKRYISRFTKSTKLINLQQWSCYIIVLSAANLHLNRFHSLKAPNEYTSYNNDNKPKKCYKKNNCIYISFVFAMCKDTWYLWIICIRAYIYGEIVLNFWRCHSHCYMCHLFEWGIRWGSIGLNMPIVIWPLMTLSCPPTPIFQADTVAG